jgi:hypothetical protein
MQRQSMQRRCEDVVDGQRAEDNRKPAGGFSAEPGTGHDCCEEVKPEIGQESSVQKKG